MASAFISHASRDQDMAASLSEQLKSLGMEPPLDFDPPGIEWNDGLVSAIRDTGARCAYRNNQLVETGSLDGISV